MRRIPIIACLIANVCFAARPVIFDTDMGNDIDDALALAMLHALSDRGECELIGVTLTNAHPAAVPYIRMLNRFYGRDDLPVGAAIQELKGGAGDGYMRAAIGAAPAGSASTAEAAPALLRRLLSNAREKVVIVQTGFSTNLAALLDLPDGAALAKQKVALVVAMAGNFAGGEPEYNVRIDVASAKAVFERWPTPHQHRTRFRVRAPAPHRGILPRLSPDALRPAHMGSHRRSRCRAAGASLLRPLRARHGARGIQRNHALHRRPRRSAISPSRPIQTRRDSRSPRAPRQPAARPEVGRVRRRFYASSSWARMSRSATLTPLGQRTEHSEQSPQRSAWTSFGRAAKLLWASGKSP